MSAKVPKKSPAIKGLLWHRDQYYSFFIPNNWYKLSWSDDRQGVIYAPDASDPLTVFAVSLTDLGTPVTEDDLDALAEGFFETIEQLPESHIELREQKVAGKMLELQAKYTSQENGETLKRWVRVFYHEKRQIAMTAQGVPEKYDYWLPWFFEAMMTANVHRNKPQISFFD
ncbi:MAG: hypothetical protein WAM60_00655 [Candidatus Promineifilaceae bacterium]